MSTTKLLKQSSTLGFCVGFLLILRTVNVQTKPFKLLKFAVLSHMSTTKQESIKAAGNVNKQTNSQEAILLLSATNWTSVNLLFKFKL